MTPEERTEFKAADRAIRAIGNLSIRDTKVTRNNFVSTVTGGAIDFTIDIDREALLKGICTEKSINKALIAYIATYKLTF